MLHLVTSTKRVSPVSSFSSLERPIRASKAYSTLRIAYSIGSRVRSKYKYEHLLVSPDADLTKDQVSNSSAHNAPLAFSCCDVTCKLEKCTLVIASCCRRPCSSDRQLCPFQQGG